MSEHQTRADHSIEFASLLCSRLCHDLLSPIGSFGNGLELLADDPDADMRDNCIGLLESSARAAIGKLKFFRLAFGASGGYGDSLPSAELTEAVAGLIPESRTVDVRWVGQAEPVPKAAARVLLALAMSVAESLVRGGRIDMAIETRGAEQEIAVRGAGDRVVLDADSRAAFADAQTPVSPKTIGIALARRIARASGGDIMLSEPAAGEIVVGAILRDIAG